MTNTNSDFNLKLMKYDVFPLLKYSKHTKDFADKALNNVIIPFPGFDPTKFDENYWLTDKTNKYGASYQLYIQSLRICASILDEYEKSGEEVYFKKAEEIIKSWIKYSETEPHEKMVWYDHPTANRVQVIIQYLYIAQEKNKNINHGLFTKVLNQHAIVLSDDSIYNNNNHGLMMDRALMVIGNVLNDEKLFLKGYYRAIDTFWYSFSSKGIHLENSPDYHNMVLRMYKELEKYLNDNGGKSFGENIKGYLKLAHLYPKAVIKPNGQYPAIGDSGNNIYNVKKSYHNIFDYEAGIAVLQYEQPKPFYLSFISGYSSKVHKHKDDLSICLNYNGKDFLVDPGKYNYSKSKERKYITSRKAHSSIQMKDFDYAIKNENRFNRKIEFTDYLDNDTFTVVKGKHGDHTGSHAILKRTVVLVKDNPLTFLLDEVDTNVKHNLNFIQNFNLDSRVEVVEETDKIRLENDGDSICIKQMLESAKPRIIKGDKSVPIAINATGFGKSENTQQIQYEKASNRGKIYCTALYDDEIVKNIETKFVDTGVILVVNEKEYFINL